MTSWAEKDRSSVRVDEIGDVARPFTQPELEGKLQPLAVLVHRGEAPALTLLYPVLGAIRMGRSTERRMRVVSRDVGALAAALVLVLVLVLDARQPDSCRRIHDALRALSMPCLDALEDMLARYPAIRPLVEAERMHRLGLLARDWKLVHSPQDRTAPGTIAARVVAPLRMPTATA